jgi:hypothetical protein
MIDIQAVRNAVIEGWSNGHTEGQINRLKTLKRAMSAEPTRSCSGPNCYGLAKSPIAEFADDLI